MASDFEVGVLTGLLIGEGHFGGDGRQPHVVLRMHTRHESLFRWIERTFPGGRLYGPYDHSGRRYYQWMARGAYLRDELLPLLERTVNASLDGYAAERLARMTANYAVRLNRSAPEGTGHPGTGETPIGGKPAPGGSADPPDAAPPDRGPPQR